MEHQPSTPDIEDRIQEFRRRGNCCFKNRDFFDAIAFYLEGLSLDRYNPCLNNNIAQAYLEVRDFKMAECHAILAIRAQDSVKAYYRAATACVGLGDKLKAVKYLKAGIENCNNSNTEDLKNALQKLSREDIPRTEVAFQRSQEDVNGTEEVLHQASDSEPEKCTYDDKLQSQVVSRASTSTTSLDSDRTSTGTQRSVSVTRTGNGDADFKVGKNLKKKNKKREIIEQNSFLEILSSIKKEEGIEDITPEKFWSMQRNKLKSLMKDGSELMGRGLSRRAVEKYKTALDMILDHSVESFRMKEMDLVVLKYALCVGWIDLADYGEIVKAAEHLKNIEETRASKFPAVFYGLGNAYYKLNRYKIAKEHLEKGLLFLKREVNFEVHSWPGTNDVIPETTRNGLQEVLNELLKMCRTYHEPDAICRYSKCLNISSHIVPSEQIFYSDPDFCGFVVVFCQEKCRVEYHMGCWKDYKEDIMSAEIGKLSEKDFIGRFCPTTDCVTQTNERSVITKIEIVGEDTTVKTSIEAPKIQTTIKESKKTKKKKGDKTAEATTHDKPKIKVHSKTKKNISETIQTASQDMQAPSSTEELALRLDKLEALRDVNFGYTSDNHWNPRESYYGREDVRNLNYFLSPEFTEETEEIRGRKEFIFSYFYEFIRNEGPQRIQDLEQKWQNENGDFEGVSDIINSQTNICTFLRQSYRFATVEDYVCLAEQLAKTYNMAKTDLVEILSFMLVGNENHTNILPVTPELSAPDFPYVDLELYMTDSLNTHSNDSKPPVESVLGSLVPKLPVLANGCEALSPHTEVDDLVDDPGIHSAEDIELATNRLLADGIESGKEGQALVARYSSSDYSEELDNTSDDCEEKEKEDDNEQQDKKQMTQKENATNNHEGKGRNEKVDTEKKEIEDELGTGLNPDANEFKPLDIVGPEQGELQFHFEGNVEAKTAVGIVPASADKIHITGAASDRVLGLSTHEKWSAEDGQPRVPPVYLSALSSEKAVLPLPQSRAQQVVHMSTFASPVLPSQRLSELSDSTTQTNEMQNFEKEVISLKSKVHELKQQLEEDNSEKEALKKALELKLEQKDKRIKELELEMATVVEERNKDIKILEEKLTKKEEDCEAWKVKLKEEKKEWDISQSNIMDIMRNLISQTGQKVKEVEEELTLQKCDARQYKLHLLEAKKEARELQISILKQSCLDTLNTMQCAVKYLTDSDVSTRNVVTAAIRNWEQYSISIIEHQVQFQAYCSSLKEKLDSVTSEDFASKFPDLPKQPTLDTVEEILQKLLDEKEDIEGKLVKQDKAVTSIKEGQQSALSAIKEQCLRLKKATQNRQEVIKNPGISQEPAIDPSKPLAELNKKYVDIFEPATLKAVKIMEKNPDNAALPVYPSPGVPYFLPPIQQSRPQLPVHSSPIFWNHMPMAMGTMPAVYEQHHTRPVINLGSAGQHGVQPASKGIDMASTRHAELKTAPSSFITGAPRASVSATDMADKLQPVLESQTVPKEKISTSGLTPIELATDVSKQSATAVATSQEIADPIITKVLPVSTSTSWVPKQNLQQISKPVETCKPLLPTPSNKSLLPTPSNKSLLPTPSNKPLLPTPSNKSLLPTPSNIPAASALESRPDVISAPKTKKSSSFQKLMEKLCKHFPTKTQDELAASVAAVREQNNNSLTGLQMPAIISMVDKFLREKSSKKQGSMGLDKFGSVWGGVRSSAADWSKTNDNSEDDCIICMEPMDGDQTSLHCKHSFHTECIRKWLQNESVCPICRVFTRMVDEFPPLS